jgi:6-phosphogluconolactonase
MDGMNFSRHSLKLVSLVLALLALFAAPSVQAQPGKSIFYVGTYTGNGNTSKGIYAYRLDAATGESTPLGLVAETTNPSFVALSPDSRYLYAVNELDNYQGGNTGGVSAFAVDRPTGRLTFLNEVGSRGADPCYIIVDKSGKHVLVANYVGDSVAVFPVLEDGKLGEASDFIARRTGHGANPQRQEAPHAHSIDLSPDNHYGFVNDLGLDELFEYKFDSANGTLTPTDPPIVKFEPGAGPRHLVFGPKAKFAYVIAEMESTVTVFSFDQRRGVLLPRQRISTLPKDFTGGSDASEIRMAPSGKFLYASNRRHDSIAVFAVDSQKGTLTPVEFTPTQGKIPRSFDIDPSGNFLLAANQKSDNIVVFRIDQTTGRLTPTGQTLKVGSPVCVKFMGAQ